MWLNTYNNVSLRQIRNEYTGRLIQVQKNGGGC